MLLSELARGVPDAVVEAGGEFEVRRLTYDSRRARPGDLFVAVAGLQVDGHDYASDAAARGAAVALERPVPLPQGTPWLRLGDTRWGLGELAAVLHDRPARRLQMVGVTGTDGKTTVTHMAAHVLESAGVRTGYLSTVGLRAGQEVSENTSGQSTMESPEVQATLASMVAAGMTAAVVETTSHALLQGRVSACDFDVAAVTNVGHDHLDYHGSWEGYLRAKALIIELCAAAAPKGVVKTAVLNRDDASHQRLRSYRIPRRLGYSIEETADLTAREVVSDAGGSRFLVEHAGKRQEARLGLPALFNVSNALCAAAIGISLGLSLEQVAAGLSSFPGVRGRLERIDLGQEFSVYLDYAHSASSLASVLAALRAVTAGRLLAVFGATGRADHDRPGMGRAAAQGADWFVITTDDPVREDPAEIARQVEFGAGGRVRGRDYEVEPDRRLAIRRALGLARPGDVVLLAGKGHEQTMILAGGPEPWDERAEAEAALRDLGHHPPPNVAEGRTGAARRGETTGGT
jgi:UDP-N-acetylmuramoyl-L-alanyl-D-glutamate--2,6-diaminopimelate ligase